MAILSMSDHYSRSKARGTDTVMGGFFGTYKDGVWEAIGSFGIPTIAAGSLQSTDMLLYVLLPSELMALQPLHVASSADSVTCVSL